MLARDYTKQIEVYQYTDTPDGFGGNTVSAESLGFSWARMENKSTSISQRATSLGLTELHEPLIFRIRYTDTVNNRANSLVYLGNEYVIQSIVDVDQMHRELEIFCIKNENSTIKPAKDTTFDYTFNFKLA